MIKQLIEVFLNLNPDPSDAQVHSLAEALGIDKESLEAEMYEMLTDCVECTDTEVCAAHRLMSATDFELTLIDEIPEEKVTKELVVVNDGELDDSATSELQDLLMDDGGIAPDMVQRYTENDGLEVR